MTDSWSFDAQTAATASPDGLAELPSSLQAEGRLWPYPGDLVSDHSTEGAQGKPATRAVPTDPKQGPLWSADHDGDAPPAARGAGLSGAAPAAGNHDGSQGKSNTGVPNIGRPFVVEVRRFMRHLASNVYDPTGKLVNPVDAPSAPVQIYGSQHYTRPRMIEPQIGPLFTWAWPSGDSFATSNPGYLGVSDTEPDMAARPQGAVMATGPDDPYVAGAGTPAPAPEHIDYDDLGLW
jgi:hypothetical protein